MEWIDDLLTNCPCVSDGSEKEYLAMMIAAASGLVDTDEVYHGNKSLSVRLAKAMILVVGIASRLNMKTINIQSRKMIRSKDGVAGLVLPLVSVLLCGHPIRRKIVVTTGALLNIAKTMDIDLQAAVMVEQGEILDGRKFQE